jgi:hypothetical protein
MVQQACPTDGGKKSCAPEAEQKYAPPSSGALQSQPQEPRTYKRTESKGCQLASTSAPGSIFKVLCGVARTTREQILFVVSHSIFPREHLAGPEGECPMDSDESGQISSAKAEWSLVRVGIRVLEDRGVLRRSDPRPVFADVFILQEAGVRCHQGELAGNKVENAVFRWSSDTRHVAVEDRGHKARQRHQLLRRKQ